MIAFPVAGEGRLGRPFQIAQELAETLGEVDGIVQVPWTVRELAERYGVSAGTMQSHLSVLQRAGIKVGSRPFLLDVQVLRRGPRPMLRLVTDEGPPEAQRPKGPTGSPWLRERHEAEPTVDGCGTSARVIDGLVALGREALDRGDSAAFEVVVRGLTDVTHRACATRDVVREPVRDELRDALRGTSRKKPKVVNRDNEGLIYKEEASSLVEDSRETDSRTRAAPRQRVNGPHQRTREELQEVLRPLLDWCEERKVPGLQNPAGALDAFSTVPDHVLAFAARKLVSDLSKGRIHADRPVGLLISRCVDPTGPDSELFSPDAPLKKERALTLRLFDVDLDFGVEQWPGLIRDRAAEYARRPSAWSEFDRSVLDLTEADLAAVDAASSDLVRVAAMANAGVVARVGTHEDQRDVDDLGRRPDPSDVRALLAEARRSLS